MDRIHKVVITGFVIQKDYMDTPDCWEWNVGNSFGEFIDTPDITCTELVEATKVEVLETDRYIRQRDLGRHREFVPIQSTSIE